MVRSSKLFFVLGCLLLAIAIALPHVLVDVPYFVLVILYGLAGGAFFSGVLSAFSPDGCDTGPPRVRQRYLREFLPAMVGYMVLLFVSLLLLKRMEKQRRQAG